MNLQLIQIILISYAAEGDSSTSGLHIWVTCSCPLLLRPPALGVIFYADRGAGQGNSYNSVYVNFTREINFKVVATPRPSAHGVQGRRRWAMGDGRWSMAGGEGESELMAPQAVANAFVSLKVTGGAATGRENQNAYSSLVLAYICLCDRAPEKRPPRTTMEIL